MSAVESERSVPSRPPGGALSARFGPSTLRAALWALLALRKASRDLSRTGFGAVVAPPPRVEWGARRGVHAMLRRYPNTCLERALVLQRWLTARGFRHDVVIGVARIDGQIKAHAWLDFETAAGLPYDEIHRLPP